MTDLIGDEAARRYQGALARLYDTALEGSFFDCLLDVAAEGVPEAAITLLTSDPRLPGGTTCLHRAAGAQHARALAPSDAACAVLETDLILIQAPSRRWALRTDTGSLEAPMGNAPRWLRHLVPHMMRAARLHAHVLDARYTQQDLQATFDLLPCPAFAIDADRRIERRNAAAATGSIEPLLVGADGRLHARTPEIERLLDARIAECTAACHTAAVVFRLPDGPVLCLRRLPSACRDGARLLITAEAGPDVLHLDGAVLNALYGLGAQEARIAGALLAGRSVGELARDWQLSKQTLRNRLSSVMSKTKTCRQAELVAQLARVAVAARA